MKDRTLRVRLAASSLLAVSAASLVFGLLAWQLVASQMRREARLQSAGQLDDMMGRLGTIDQLTRQQLQSSMRILQDEARLRGQPSLGGFSRAAGRDVPDLRFGSESQVENYVLVDRVKQLAGGTATLFVWNGADFIRAATNVLKPDGSRAVGTALDRSSLAFAALVQRRPFTGVVEILGTPYTTSYIPMLDGSGSLIGAWYTGYRLDSIASLTRGIEDARILDHGFVALLKPSGSPVTHGKNISDSGLASLLPNPRGWVVQKQAYPAWGYTVLAAYPDSDVWKHLLKSSGLIAAGILLLVGVVVGFQSLLLERQVLRPVRTLATEMAKADLNSLMEVGRKDEIGVLADSFNQFVLRLRHTLLEVRDGSLASTAKSNEIRAVSTETVARMAQQLRGAEQASSAVAELSQHISSTACHSGEALHSAQAAAQAARQGGELVASTVKMIEGVAQDTRQSASRIRSLSDRVQQIGSIVEVIEEIAAGTNLLALNASIEAARAGEHGRGFAVVAAEVRRLAERTAMATRQVGELVNSIKEETGLATNGILTAVAHATDGAGAIACLNDRFDRISQLVIEVDQRISSIADASREEANAADAVTTTMQVVAGSARESAGGAEQVVAASVELLSIAQALETMVERFHMEDLIAMENLVEDCTAA